MQLMWRLRLHWRTGGGDWKRWGCSGLRCITKSKRMRLFPFMTHWTLHHMSPYDTALFKGGESWLNVLIVDFLPSIVLATISRRQIFLKWTPTQGQPEG